MSLEQELATYHAKLPEWKEHEGKFVLIKGERVVDIFSAYEDALKAGLGNLAWSRSWSDKLRQCRYFMHTAVL